MRNPAGVECQFFFGDYYRGREREECRLLASANPPLPWSPDLCTSCPVPAIINANACPDLVMVPEVTRALPLLKRQVRVRAHCIKTNRRVDEPQIGCGECHPLPEFTLGATFDPDPPA